MPVPTLPTPIPPTLPRVAPTTPPSTPTPTLPTLAPTPTITIQIPSQIIYSVEPVPTNAKSITSGDLHHKTKHETSPGMKQFSYVSDYTTYYWSAIMYGGVDEYLTGTDRQLYVNNLEDSYKKFLDDPIQDVYMGDYIEYIKSTAKYSDDQVVNAVRFVQNIPYDEDRSQSQYEVRYPYQVLYDGEGVCSEKALLLIYTLKKLGYGTAYMVFDEENHAVVGLKCDPIYAYKHTNYCFIESTTPTMITYTSLEYGYSGKLTSEPLVYTMSDGRTFHGIDDEYNDAIRFGELQSHAEENEWVLSVADFNEWFGLVRKYGIKCVGEN
jgi:hypothetical protein